VKRVIDCFNVALIQEGKNGAKIAFTLIAWYTDPIIA
jgi:hypothetical protein